MVELEEVEDGMVRDEDDVVVDDDERVVVGRLGMIADVREVVVVKGRVPGLVVVVVVTVGVVVTGEVVDGGVGLITPRQN